MVKIKNIKWGIDMEDILAVIDEMTVEKAAETLEIPLSIYVNMNTQEIHNYIWDMFDHNIEARADVIDLPSESEIPEGVEDIADYSNMCEKPTPLGVGWIAQNIEIMCM